MDILERVEDIIKLIHKDGFALIAVEGYPFSIEHSNVVAVLLSRGYHVTSGPERNTQIVTAGAKAV